MAVLDPVAPDAEIGGMRNSVVSLGSNAEADEQVFLADEVESSVVGDEVCFELKEGPRVEVDLVIQPVNSGSKSREKLVEDTKTDPSLPA